MKRSSPKTKIIILLLVVLAMAGLVWWQHGGRTTDLFSAKATVNNKQYSHDDPNSIWVVVNKTRPLPNGYTPADLVVPNVALRLDKTNEEMHLRQAAANALEQLFAGAQGDGGHSLLLASGYRSQTEQKQLYDFYVQAKGASAADSDSARPGYSEHQTGLAADVGRSDHQCEVQQCFADTAEGKWLAENAYKYGFIIRYSPNKQAITGYVQEPWHLRYVGKDLARQVKQTSQTLEEYFKLPPAPDYK